MVPVNKWLNNSSSFSPAHALRPNLNQEFPGGPVVRPRAFTDVAQVQSLVGKLRSRKLHGVTKNKKQKANC